MYLPSEIDEEPYRDRAELVQLNNGRAQLVRAITAATRLVVYGLGLSALDAELGQVVASRIHGSTVREIRVIDPKYVDVAERADLGFQGGRCPLRILQSLLEATAPAQKDSARQQPCAQPVTHPHDREATPADVHWKCKRGWPSGGKDSWSHGMELMQELDTRREHDRVRDALAMRHYSPRTVKADVGWIRRFIVFHERRHPADMGAVQVSTFLSSLARAGAWWRK